MENEEKVLVDKKRLEWLEYLDYKASKWEFYYELRDEFFGEDDEEEEE